MKFFFNFQQYFKSLGCFLLVRYHYLNYFINSTVKSPKLITANYFKKQAIFSCDCFFIIGITKMIVYLNNNFYTSMHFYYTNQLLGKIVFFPLLLNQIYHATIFNLNLFL